MAWYKTGTISVTNGSTTVTGSGTSWIAGAGIGEALYAPDGRIYEIANISSDTSLTLGSAYLGSNQSGQSYTIIPSQSYIRDLAADASNLISQYASIASGAGAGKFTDGSAATPGIAFSSDVDTGIYRASTNTLGIAAGGVSQMTVNTSGANIPIISNNPTLSAGTANGVLYLNGSKAVSSGSGLVFDGSNLGLGVTPSAWSGAKAFELSAGASIVGQAFNPTLVGNAYYNGTNWIYRTSGRATKYEPNVGGDGVHSWFAAPSGTAGNPISFTQAMTLDASGNLGVGTTSPVARLSVSGGVGNGITYTDGTVINFVGTASGSVAQLGTTSNHFLQLITNGTAKATLDSSGNLGLGTSSPGTKLEVAGRVQAKSSSDVNLAFVLNNTASGGREWQMIGSATGGLDGGGTFNLRDNTAGANRLTVDASGNLGLGVTPSAWGIATFQSYYGVFAGNLEFSASANCYYNSGWKYLSSGVASRYSQAAGIHTWHTAPSGTAGNPISFTQAMTLDASGNLLVGTTSTSSTAPAAITVSANTGVTKSAITCIDSGTSYGAGNQYISFINSSGAGAGSIQHTAATTVNYATASDARLKKNITIATDALPVVSNIAVRAFDWKEDDAHVMFGFIAQELYTNYPDAVCVGDDGAELTNPKGTWQVDYGKLTPLLLKAIQEQQAIITELRSRIEALESI